MLQTTNTHMANSVNEYNILSREMNAAILSERRDKHVHFPLKRLCAKLNCYHRNTALIFGDASCIQAEYLLQSGFTTVHIVDSSNMLMDEEIIPLCDSRLIRSRSKFEDFIFPADSMYDLIYGKSLAFTHPSALPQLLKMTCKHLISYGLYAGVFALGLDEFHPPICLHELPMIVKLHNEAGFIIDRTLEHKPHRAQALVSNDSERIAHFCTIFAHK